MITSHLLPQQGCLEFVKEVIYDLLLFREGWTRSCGQSIVE